MNSTVAQWKSEATVFNSWRDQCWIIINPIINNLKPEDITPSIDDIVAALPIIQWPV